ncbi:DUF6418 domain-containing protein [Bradyrhizobium yuanmingense]|uniref:DUF6418 domain-containing protein n=1 Tax=Bradyrhizobium yuanmingense TaxID=108015 RepID=UPI0023B89D89|nr:DUF6418 domain-containing protein [Bradyrhizobium yuanmingense]MDF0497937.1 DUF6418 domain-containing protein [Bradyrhizobium yuanmingense]
MDAAGRFGLIRSLPTSGVGNPAVDGDEMQVSWWSMESVFPAMLCITAVGAMLAAMGRIAISRPGLLLILFFFFFAFAWRLLSVLYIDVFGPVYSEQLERELGPGLAVLPLAASQALIIAALLFSFRPQRLHALSDNSVIRNSAVLKAGAWSLADLAFCVVGLFVLALWLELLIRGHIPLLAGLERFDYARLYGGPLHQRLLEWGPMLAFQLGVLLSLPALCGKPLDRRFGALFAALMLYLFAVGHRFSSFYLYLSFLMIPMGAVLLGKQWTGAISLGKLIRRVWLPALGFVLLVGIALIYSYAVVRGSETVAIQTKLVQRILVQQGEMWWMTYERVFLRNDWNGDHAFFKLFVDPFNPNRNSTMQFLMEIGLPLERAQFIIAQGSAYTGGWPEVLFELGGPAGGFCLVAISAILFSEFMFLLTRCLVEERYVTCFFLTPIFYALSIFLVSGMVNSFIQLTFIIKIAAAVFAYVLEDRWRWSLITATPSVAGKPVV